MKNSIWLSCMFIVGMSLASGCSFGGKEVLGSITEIAAPATGESGEPNLSVGPSGKVYLSWIEVDDAGRRSLRFSTRTGDGWSTPGTVIQSNTIFQNWADYPSFSELSDGTLAAHWLSEVPDREGYNVSVAISRDMGQNWSDPVTPHRDDTATEHGFVSLVPANDGVGVIWLDSRKLEEGSDDVSLMYTRIGTDGQLADEAEIDSRVCECCQPSSIAVPGGILTVYRDRSAEEIRDIVITRFDGTRWSEPQTIADDHWEIYACPIQGPSISASGESVAVAWFTGANDQPKVQIAFSANGGETFGAPIRVDEGDPVGRVAVASLEDGGAVVAWIEHTDRGGEVRARQVDSGGRLHDPVTIGKTSLGTASGFPRVIRTGDSVVFAWTDTDDRKIRTSESGSQ